MPTSICHVEINVSDVDAGQKFYSELFGWTSMI
jgi:predicted enzyme related to lactoylglutathione lyase